MKKAAIILVVGSLLLLLAGAAFAGEKLGAVAAVDVDKGVLTLKDGTQFDGVTVSLLKGWKSGDNVMVVYKEDGGKKVVTKITSPPIGC
jgi:Cu/Ag efflux protein CusF